jgi:hypothetical protein
VTDRFICAPDRLRITNWKQSAVVVAVVQQQLVVVECVVLFCYQFEDKSVGEAVQQIVDEFVQ